MTQCTFSCWLLSGATEWKQRKVAIDCNGLMGVDCKAKWEKSGKLLIFLSNIPKILISTCLSLSVKLLQI